MSCFSFSLWWLLLSELGCRVCGFQELPHMDSAAVVPGLWSTGSIVVVSKGYSSLQYMDSLFQWLSCCSGFSCAEFSSCHTWTQQLWFLGSGALAQWLWCRGLISLLHEESFCNRVQTHVSCITRWILYH